MKKKIALSITVIVVLILAAEGYYSLPKTFGKDVTPSDVDRISVFDGNTGVGFTITNPEDIKYIVENIQGHSMKKEGISLGRMGYGFKIRYIDGRDNDVIPAFILNSDDTIRKDPFFYVCEEGLCFDYIKDCEEAYETNAAESAEEKALKDYTQNSDGTWACDGNTYQYRLEITGRMNQAVCDSTFVYLSNMEEITFEQAWKASGLSSNTDDYFDVKDAVLVEWETEE